MLIPLWGCLIISQIHLVAGNVLFGCFWLFLSAACLLVDIYETRERHKELQALEADMQEFKKKVFAEIEKTEK